MKVLQLCFSKISGYSVSLDFHIYFRDILPIYAKTPAGFDGDCVQSTDQFGENCHLHLNNIESSNQ